jgi:hypothetical protein
LAVDKIQGEVHQLLTRLVVPRNADEIPLGNNCVSSVEGESALTTGWQALSIDRNVSITADILGLVDLKLEGLELCLLADHTDADGRGYVHTRGWPLLTLSIKSNE